MNDEVKNPTLESVREELRSALLMTGFDAVHRKVAGQEQATIIMKQTAHNLAAFGGNCGLISAEEATDWIAAFDEKDGKNIGEVSQRWMKT